MTRFSPLLLSLYRGAAPRSGFVAAHPATGTAGLAVAGPSPGLPRRDIGELVVAVLLAGCEMVVVCAYGCLLALVCSAVLAPGV